MIVRGGSGSAAHWRYSARIHTLHRGVNGTSARSDLTAGGGRICDCAELSVQSRSAGSVHKVIAQVLNEWKDRNFISIAIGQRQTGNARGLCSRFVSYSLAGERYGGA